MVNSETVHFFFQNRLSGNFLPFAHENLMDIEENSNAKKVRALFVSDMHLGTRICRADLILSFLKKYEAETIYLIGDIIDGWQLKKSWYWPALHEKVLWAIINKAAKGSRVVYVPGNHDDFLRSFSGKKPSGVEVTETTIHTTASGRRFLVMHGDELDAVMRSVPWLAHVGDAAYDALIALNFAYNRVSGLLGFKYRSLAAMVKKSVKRAVSFIGKFEEELVTTGRDCGVDGVICGHIHHATIRDIGKLCYVNTGDWVENFTAIVENVNGELELCFST